METGLQQKNNLQRTVSDGTARRRVRTYEGEARSLLLDKRWQGVLYSTWR